MNTRQTAYAMLSGLGHYLLAGLAVGLLVSLLLTLLVLLLTPGAHVLSAEAGPVPLEAKRFVAVARAVS
jgi:hypothetical protein